MYKKTLTFAALCFIFVLPQAPRAAAVNCAALQAKNCRKIYDMNPTDVQQCISRGFDAPVTCRKNSGQSAGVRVDGSSGFSYGTIQAPQNSPGAVHAEPTVDTNTIIDSLGFDWNGGCKIFGINICPDGKPLPPPLDPTLPCAAADDPHNRLGEKQTLAAGALKLECGGALPLTNSEVTLNQNPNRLAVTEFKSYELRLYQRGGDGVYRLNGQYIEESLAPTGQIVRIPKVSPTGVIPLPSHLCTFIIPTSPPLPSPPPPPFVAKTVELTPSIAQMITYNSGDSLNIRLMGRDTIKKGWHPLFFGLPVYANYFHPATDDNDVPSNENFLVIPIEAGVPIIPANCATENRFFKKVSVLSGDIMIEAPTNFCIGNEEECNAALEQGIAACQAAGGGAECPTSVSTSPTADQSCDVVKLPLKQPPACAGKMQYVVLNRHNLVYPPGTNATLEKVDGRTALLAPSTDASRIFTQKDTNIRLGLNAPPVTLNEGGTLLLSNGARLKLFAPGTVDVGRVTMTGGGQLISASGKLLKSYPNNTSVPVNDPVLPYVVNVNRSFNMPLKYMVPTQPAEPPATGPSIKLPLEAPPKPKTR